MSRLDAPVCVACNKREAAQILAHDGEPLGPICAPCEFRLMRRIRSEVGGDEGRAGWAKFCAERGYNVRASTFEDARR